MEERARATETHARAIIEAHARAIVLYNHCPLGQEESLLNGSLSEGAGWPKARLREFTHLKPVHFCVISALRGKKENLLNGSLSEGAGSRSETEGV